MNDLMEMILMSLLSFRRVTDLVAALQKGRPRTLKLTIVRQRDKLEIVFKVSSFCLQDLS